MSDTLLPPHERLDQIGRAGLESDLRKIAGEGAFSHGWLIAAPKGAGKATLAYRLARGLLAPDSLKDTFSFDVDGAGRAAKMVAARAHPDLFVAERRWNDKTSRYQTEITIETIRELTLFLNHTPAMGGYRVAIIDRADDLNRNAANALLKALEEPRADTLLLLLAEAPGRLLATIRSRCRRIDLRPVDEDEIAALLAREGLAEGDEAKRIAAACGGRPGYALALAAGDGDAAIKLADAFLKPGRTRADLASVAAALSGRAGEGKWETFVSLVTARLAQAARLAARGAAAPAPFSGVSPAGLVAAWEQVSMLAARGDGLNLDRGELVSAMAYDLRAALSAR